MREQARHRSSTLHHHVDVIMIGDRAMLTRPLSHLSVGSSELRRGFDGDASHYIVDKSRGNADRPSP